MTQKSAFLIITEDSPESYSPAGERARHLALASSLFFDKVVVLALGAQKYSNQQEKESKILLHEIKWSRGLPYPIMAVFDPIKVVLLFLHGLIMSRRYKTGYILALMPPIETGVTAWLLARLFHMKLAIDLNDDWESAMRSELIRYFPERLMPPVFWIAAKIYSFSSCMLVVTRTLANIIRQRGIKTPLIVAPNGADTSIFCTRSPLERQRIKLNYSIPRDKIVVAYCGSGVAPYYRLDMIFSSVTLLPNDIRARIFLVFYLNDGEERLTRLKKELSIPSSLIDIRAPLPRSNLAEVLAACDIGLVPFDNKQYLLYATSTKVYEYLSTGLYVISSGPRGGELNSIFSSNPELGVFTASCAEEFAQALEQITLTEDLLKDDFRNIRNEFIKRDYDRKKSMVKAVKILNQRILN